MILMYWKQMVVGLLLVLSFIAGWQVKGAFVAKRDLAIKEAQDAMIKELQNNEVHIANILELKLKDLKANEKTIIRDRTQLIDRPIYNNVCLDDDGVRLIERARTSKASSSKPTSEVSGAK